jgi:7-cyano-7-deazaguanine synthase
MSQQHPAVVLLSGGLDSAVTLAIAQSEGFAVHPLSFRYGQRHGIELAAACRTARSAGVERRHRDVDVGLRAFGGSALTDSAIAVPTEPTAGIPATYVPARNTIFLSYALAFAETVGARDIFIGANQEDHEGYPDCRPAYFDAWARLAGLATREPVQIHTPLINLDKAAVIRLGLDLGVNFAATWSCYDPIDEKPCARCDACRSRAAGFAAVGIDDPAVAR